MVFAIFRTPYRGYSGKKPLTQENLMIAIQISDERSRKLIDAIIDEDPPTIQEPNQFFVLWSNGHSTVMDHFEFLAFAGDEEAKCEPFGIWYNRMI
jgi:hypothetical protein